jgi:hypothetical protein
LEIKIKSDIKSLMDYFTDLEQELGLLKYEVSGVKIWQYLRTRIFLRLAYEKGIYGLAHTKKIGFFDLLKAFPSLLFYSVFSNPLCGYYKKDILIFNSGRKINVDNNLIDIYTKHLTDDFKTDEYEIIEELFENKHLTREFKNRTHEDYIQIVKIIKSKFSLFKFNADECEFIRVIEMRFQKDLKVKIDLCNLFRNGCLFFLSDFKIYRKILKKRKPKRIFLVSAYTNKKAIIAAAKAEGVECVEIQHGVINNNSIGYYYADMESVEYFPDKIYVFGQYWKDAVKFPLKDKNIYVNGFPFLKMQIEKYKNEIKNKSQILIISQGTIGRQLSKIIFEGIQELEEYELVYKLHPGEYGRWRTEYPELMNLSKLSNVRVIENDDENLHHYLSKSRYVIGVYSTAIYEALAFDCQIMVVNLPGIEFVEDLISNDVIKLIHTMSDAHKVMIEDNFKSISSDYLFA